MVASSLEGPCQQDIRRYALTLYIAEGSVVGSPLTCSFRAVSHCVAVAVVVFG